MTAPALELTRQPRSRSSGTTVLFLLGLGAPLAFLRLAEGVNLVPVDFLLAGLAVHQFTTGQWGFPRRLHHLFAIQYAFVLTLMAASLRSPDTGSALAHIGHWLFLLFVLIPTTLRVLEDRTDVDAFALGIAAAMGLVLAYGIYEVEVLPKPYRSYRYNSLYGQAQFAAFNIALCFPFVVYYARRCFAKRLRLRCVAMVGLAGGLLWFLTHTLSRSGMLAVLTASLIQWSLWPSRNRSRDGRVLVRFVCGSLVLGALVLMYLDRAPDEVVARVDQVLEEDSAKISGRTDGYVDAWNADASLFLLGTGPDNYHHVSVRQQKPHNAVLLMMVEGGVLTATLYLVILAFPIALGLQALARERRMVAAAPGAGLGAVIATSLAAHGAFLVVSAFNTQTILRVYWLNVAVLLAASLRMLREPEPAA